MAHLRHGPVLGALHRTMWTSKCLWSGRLVPFMCHLTVHLHLNWLCFFFFFFILHPSKSVLLQERGNVNFPFQCHEDLISEVRWHSWLGVGDLDPLQLQSDLTLAIWSPVPYHSTYKAIWKFITRGDHIYHECFTLYLCGPYNRVFRRHVLHDSHLIAAIGDPDCSLHESRDQLQVSNT